jgi:hypothetical protein
VGDGNEVGKGVSASLDIFAIKQLSLEKGKIG